MAATPTPKTTEQRLSLPLNGTIYTTTRDVNPRKGTPLIGATMASELGAAWADSYVIAAVVVPKGTLEVLRITHARIPIESAQLPSNWEFSTASLGGQTYNTVVRTVILLASAVAHATPALGSAMPFETGSIFDGQGYILIDRQVSGSGSELEPTFRTERRTYMRRCTITQLGVDSLNGKALTSTETLYYATEIVNDGKTAAELFALPNHAFWGLQADGTQRTGRQLSCAWYSVTVETVVSGTFAAGAVTVRSYETVKSYSWPPVLSSIALQTWTRRDGGKEVQALPVYSKEGYNGECRAEVVETFHVAAPTPIAAPDVMLPLPINIQNPYIGGLRIGACLFAGDTYSFTNGNNDPVYKWFIDSNVLPATTPTDWPNYVTLLEVSPFRGGYLKSTVKIYKPA